MKDNNLNTDQAINEGGVKEKASLPPHKEYAKRMASFRSKYLYVLAITATMLATGIALAFLYELIVGIGVVILSVVFYARFASNDISPAPR